MKIFIEYLDGKKRYNVLPNITSDELKKLASEEMKTDASSVSLELLDSASKEWHRIGNEVTLKKLDTLRAQIVTAVCNWRYYVVQVCGLVNLPLTSKRQFSLTTNLAGSCLRKVL